MQVSCDRETCEARGACAPSSVPNSPPEFNPNFNQFQALGLRGLFPAGEGAGYAGGIVSAAVDGIRVAEALLPVLVGGIAAARASGAPSGAAQEEVGQR